MMHLQTILGSGGPVSDHLIPVLQQNNEKIRLVSRSPKSVAHAETVSADLTDFEQTLQAVKGSGVVYLLVGLQYDIRVWKKSWPRIMTNVINACNATGAKLVFFDNVYMYGKVDGAMTEETPFNPISKKGEVRAAIATQLLSEMKAGNIKAMIARSADFYGPVGFKTAIPNVLIFANLKKGKKAQWMMNAKVPHSFTYVPDAAEALYMLANKDEAYGQTWHLPTAGNPPTAAEFIQMAASAMATRASYSIINKPMMWLAGLFDRSIEELIEMAYQYEFPYLFDSTKFEKTFQFTPTSYEKGIQQTAEWVKKNQ
jgi:nucleoside-diphosphate-sugar epimerase